MRAMKTTADSTGTAYDEARQVSVNAKLDAAGKIKEYFLRHKYNAFCATDELTKMDWEDVTGRAFLKERGLELEFAQHQDTMVCGISPAEPRAGSASHSDLTQAQRDAELAKERDAWVAMNSTVDEEDPEWTEEKGDAVYAALFPSK